MAKLIVSPQAALDAAAIVELLSDKAGIDVAAKYFREIDALFERISLVPEAACAVRRSVATFDLVWSNRMSLSIAIELTP
jgi:plasmid stabilization system protein ParE